MFLTPDKKVLAKVTGDSMKDNPHHVKVGSVVELGIKLDMMSMMLGGAQAQVQRAEVLFDNNLADVESEIENTDKGSLYASIAEDLEGDELEAFKSRWDERVSNGGEKMGLCISLDDLEIISDIPEIPEKGSVLVYTTPLKGFDDEGKPLEITTPEALEEVEDNLLGHKVRIEGQYIGFPSTPHSPIVFGTMVSGPAEGKTVYPFLAELEEIK